MTQQIVSAMADEIRLEPYHFPPEAILAGDPAAREWSMTSDDGTRQKVISGIFEADRGTIRGSVEAFVTVYVLKGHVRIELETGDPVELGVGNVAVLPPCPVVTWTFTEPFREFFVTAEPAT